ncbi:AAA family ATPase [Mycolicibacterium arenosum]|uniref:AAA family ATPase n=1 Tax=Mycolicibacterium arenosum TaxID=2952157 RepID=A0ABT1M4E9_9MYCO|nr:AAA family ATPase [Mycolicibacterium sp. CAU 1645]MCP9274044.1 AAA family ATPase [Mycolicibacterium sp. CAU 1645]
MRITRVVGAAFGPLRAESLDFAEGLNVVHGINEAGKSSWFNATYAALAGRRKYKGKGSSAETEYKNRHKPWSGSKWAVDLAITLDDGRVLAIEQDLAKSEWRIVDASTGQAVSDADLLTDNSLDATRLLGLNRHSARATIFTGQADILRVLEDAYALQDLLAKAAATGTADATADAAVNRLDDWRKEWVGVPHGVKPLGTALKALDTSERFAGTRRDAFGDLLEAIGNRKRLAAALVDARAKVALAERFTKWKSVHDLRGRVDKAAELSAALAETNESDLTVDGEKLSAATNVLAVYDGGTDVAPLADGPTAADLQAEIDALPSAPDGDLIPRVEVVEAHSELVKAQTALDTHMQTAPSAVAPPSTTLAADELRTLADVLASTPPEVDAVAVAEFEQARDVRVARIATLHDEVEQKDIAYREAKAAYDAAALGGAQASELAVLHSAERSAADELIAVTLEQSDFLLAALGAQEAQADVMAQEVALRRHRELVDAARQRVLAEALDPNPDALKGVAREIDDARAAQTQMAQHMERAAEFRLSRENHARVLGRLLGHAAHAEVTDDHVVATLRGFADYVEACTERTEIAQQAARRPDLMAAHTQRQQLEASHREALAAREGQRRGVIEVAAALGLNVEPDVVTDELRQWVVEQESKLEASAARKTDVALLAQLLGGREFADLTAELQALTASAGPEPTEPMPPDLNAFAEQAKVRLDKLKDGDGQLKGQISTLENDLGSVAEAVEAEADATQEVARVKLLASCLDAATAELEAAKERANASIAPALAARMKPWLPRVTNGRYREAVVDPSDLKIEVTEATGQVRQAHRLSLGTTEQIYLLLRVTLSQVLSGGDETAPLIFDDVTTQSDGARTVAILELLHELSTEHQVILFTQEDEVVEWAQENVDPDRDKIIALAAPSTGR